MFYAIFQTLTETSSKVKVELKNDLILEGYLSDVDNNLNIVLKNVSYSKENYSKNTPPQLENLHNCFIRGNTVRYIRFNEEDVDHEVIQEACRKYNENENNE